MFDVVKEPLRFWWNNAFQEIALTHSGNVALSQILSSYAFNEDCCYLIQISLTLVFKGVVDKKIFIDLHNGFTLSKHQATVWTDDARVYSGIYTLLV